MNPSTNNYTVGKGVPAFGDPLRHLGNCPELSLSVDIETMEHYSSMSGMKKLDFEPNIGVTPKFAFTLEEASWQNVNMFGLGEAVSVNQTSGTSESVTVTIAKGCFYDLGKRSVSNVAITGGTSGTDFIVYAGAGMVFIPWASTLTEGSDSITFDCAETQYKKVKLYKTSQLTGPFMYKGDNPVGVDPFIIQWPRVSIRPTGDFALITDSDLLTMSFEGSILDDSENNPDAPYGTIIMPDDV